MYSLLLDYIDKRTHFVVFTFSRSEKINFVSSFTVGQVILTQKEKWKHLYFFVTFRWTERVCSVGNFVRKNVTAGNIRFGNRLAEGITIGCSSLSAIVPADEQISAFCIYLRLWFFNRLTFGRKVH